jgi:hypothetical protein
MKRLSRFASAALAAFALEAVTQTALAAPSASTGVVGAAESFLTAAAMGPTVASEPGVASSLSSSTAERGDDAAAVDAPAVDFVPNVSLVVRDWHGSMMLVGAQAMLVDDLRPTASNRMLVTRVSTNDSWFTAFGHVGVGEWRIDSVMFPNARTYSEGAGQLGAGFELRLPRGIRLAGEAQYTVLSRNLAYTADEVAPRMFGCLFAIAGRI